MSMDDTSVSAAEVILKGIAAAPGIAIGPAYLYSKHIPKVQAKTIAPEDLDVEIQRLRSATQRSEKELMKILAFAEHKLGSESAKIFEAQIMVLNDSILMGAIEGRIHKELRNAEFIVFDEISKYKRLMLAAPDEYMHERAHDVDDVMNRIIRNIQDQKLSSKLEGEAIIVSETLTPADTIIFSRNQILAYTTDLGGVTSHAALLSRSLKIPAVVGLHTATKQIRTGDFIAVDGYAGLVAIRPSDETLDGLRHKAERFKEFEQQLEGLAGLPAETLDHKRVELAANLEFVGEIDFALRQGSLGVGLYRTESELLRQTRYPSEDEQFAIYDEVAQKLFPHNVIFRTFDVGGDKLTPEMYEEDNPFLGWRGIRVCLDRQDIFLTQLRAILRASTRRNVMAMFPMVSSLLEVRKAKQLLTVAKEELVKAGVRFDQKMKIGVMIEVPSAAILADDIAAEVDFLSIGTNDLIQYLLAVDRGNSLVAPIFQPFNPAVLRTIKMIADAAHKHNRWVGMCGEMAGDPLATMVLLGLGLDELSMVPTVLPEIKKIVRSIKYKDARKLADRVLTVNSEKEIADLLISVLREKLPDLPLES
jgi:phosphotransferase system enzyme I (PtsI)